MGIFCHMVDQKLQFYNGYYNWPDALFPAEAVQWESCANFIVCGNHPLKSSWLVLHNVFFLWLSAIGLPHNLPLISAQPGTALALSKIVFVFLSPPASYKVLLANCPNFFKRFFILPPPPPHESCQFLTEKLSH